MEIGNSILYFFLNQTDNIEVKSSDVFGGNDGGLRRKKLFVRKKMVLGMRLFMLGVWAAQMLGFMVQMSFLADIGCTNDLISPELLFLTIRESKESKDFVFLDIGLRLISNSVLIETTGRDKKCKSGEKIDDVMNFYGVIYDILSPTRRTEGSKKVSYLYLSKNY
jgi:hypothetical protein